MIKVRKALRPDPVLVLFKECRVFAPEDLGRRDVLIGGGRVLAVEERIKPGGGLPVTEVPAAGLTMIPGLVDGHVHIAGAGGEGGPETRTPEVPLSMLRDGAITTVVGSLGTDGFARGVEGVLMKAKGLRREGMSAYILTGAYQVPTPTLLGDVGRDIALIEEVIGAGEIAIADHRSSCPTVTELVRLAEHARVGGMLGGKAGITLLHMGDAHRPFALIYAAVEMSELKPAQFLPTHCNRNSYIFEDAKAYGKEGNVDITTSAYPFYPEYEVKPSAALRLLLEAGVPLEHITFSSDGGGSLPLFDEEGTLLKLTSGEPRTLLLEVLDAVRKERIPMEQALKVATSNPAGIFKLKGKGRIAPGMDADLALLDADDRVRHLLAGGLFFVQDGKPARKGMFE
jgi:beta-aspartyl-dipeptidase (metallo-type)